ncbi:MAG: hypothetical protein J0L69_00590 [Bacteroidetes bacterium]|nr:hypothetical protein [Bacteroidota bacterium]
MKKLSLITIALICVAVAVSNTGNYEKVNEMPFDTTQKEMLWPVHKRTEHTGVIKGSLNFQPDNNEFSLIMN